MKQCSREGCDKTLTGYQRKYCSRSCANACSNSLSPKRKRTNTCKVCDTLIRSDRSYCADHASKDWSLITLAELRSRGKYYSGVIRRLARASYKRDMRPMRCVVCGYSNPEVLQICHVRAVSAHDDSDSVAYINRASNLVAMCPTHHAEFDKGFLDWSPGGDSNSRPAG